MFSISAYGATTRATPAGESRRRPRARERVGAELVRPESWDRWMEPSATGRHVRGLPGRDWQAPDEPRLGR